MSLRPLAALALLVLTGCGAPAPIGTAASEPSRLLPLIDGLPRGADQCVATAPHQLSDRRRATLAELSVADALGWARTPHVAAYVRCRYRGTREHVVWRVAIDGALDREALPMHVRWDGEECEADRCDWPVASFADGVLELRSPGELGARSGPGAEAELRGLAARQPRLLEARVSDESVSLFLLEGGRGEEVREVRRGEGDRRDRTLSWDEVEVLAEDQRLRRELSRREGSEPYRSGDEIAWSDSRAVLAQLELRLERLRRRSGARRGAVAEELASFALRALEERSADGDVLELGSTALIEVGRADEALARIDAAAIEADYDPERARFMRGLGWELAVRADHPSAGERLARAGLADDARDGERLAPLLAEALAREIAGPTDRRDVEDEVLRLRTLAVDAALVALDAPVVLAPLGVIPALVELSCDDPVGTPLELFAALDVEGAPAATVAVLRDGTRLLMLPGRGVHAARTIGSLEVLDAAAEALRSPGDGPFVVELRLGPAEAPTRTVRLEGTVRRGRMSLERVSPELSRWDWARIARHLVGPLAEAAELRFPSPELHFRGERPALLEQVARELAMMHLAECELDGAELTCVPRAGRHREAIVAASRTLGVLPPE